VALSGSETDSGQWSLPIPAQDGSPTFRFWGPLAPNLIRHLAPLRAQRDSTHNPTMQTDPISFDAPETITDWFAINDTVMGGLSTGRFSYDPAGHAVFDGEVSLERHGGFASVRGTRAALGSPATLGYALAVLGDGKRYEMNLRTEDSFDGVNYQAEFQTQAGQWIEVRLPLSAFAPNFRGRPVPAAPPLNPALVRQVGLMIADKQAGLFRLCIRRISAY
jgi:NADH dehydrogenase [ubiquinone] 1 alpha subcomplex assembly factor 1